MKKKRVVYIVSEIDKSLAFEWIATHLDRNKFHLCFYLIGRRNSQLAKFLMEAKVDFVEFSLRSKSNLPGIFLRIFFRLLLGRPNVVHTHLFYANLIGQTASLLAGVKKRVFTRHHALVHYNEYPQGLKWDKYLNKTATQIIAISENVKTILLTRDRADEKKITLIHHGFDLEYFKNVNEQQIQRVRSKYGLQKRPTVGVISRYLKLKGIQFIIPAFKRLLIDFPDAQLILVNAIGNYRDEIKKLLNSLPRSSFIEIEFENDLSALYRLFDVFVHAPIDAESEAFGQTYVEALASGIPAIFTLSGVAPEFIVSEENALVVPFQNPESIYQAILKILSDTGLRGKLIKNGLLSSSLFSLDKMIESLEECYEA